MRSLIALLLSALFIAGPFNAPAQQNEKTLLWRISGKGMQHPSYLYGTMHLKARKLFDFPDSLYTAIDNTEVFALEVNPDSMNDAMADYMSAAIDKNKETTTDRKEKKLSDILTPAELKKLRQNSPSSLDPGDLTVKQVYALKDKISSGKKHKDDLPTFMDAYLSTIARDKGKIIAGVEHLQDQINILDSIDMNNVDPEKVQELFSTGTSMQDQMIELYLAKDLTELQKVSDIYPPKTEEILLSSRNRHMLQSMDSIMKQHSLFCAVGALHLPGKRGLITLLRESGYAVEPVISGSHLNGADYEFKHANGEQWSETLFSNDGYAIKMPGKPSDVNAGGGTVIMKMYFDVATSTYYVTDHSSSSNDSASAAQAAEAIAERLTGIATTVKKQPVTTGGINGTEYYFTDTRDIRYRVQILTHGSDIYMLMAYAQSKLGDHIDPFFSSFRLISKSAVDKAGKTFDDIRFSGNLPNQKATRKISWSEDSSAKQVSYAVVDPAAGMFYFIVCNTPGRGYGYTEDSTMLENVLDYYKQQNITAHATEGRFAGYRMYDVITDAFKGSKIRNRLIAADNRHYNLVIQFPDNEKGLSDAETFLKSVQILPSTLMAMRVQHSDDSVFSAYAPGTFVTVKEKSDFEDTVLPTTRVYRSWDSSMLLTYQVSAKRMLPFYWTRDLQATMKEWLKDFSMESDDTALATYSAPKGQPWAEMITPKKNADKIHRMRMVTDGRTRYVLDCSYPLSMKNDKRIDSFFTTFRVLKKDTAHFKQTPDAYLADLFSSDSATKAYAKLAANEVTFTKDDVPAMIKTLATWHNEDTAILYQYNSLVTELKRFGKDMSMQQLEQLYHDPVIARKGLQGDVLEMMTMQKDSVAAFKTIKQLLLTATPKKGFLFQLTYKLKSKPALAKTFFPDLLALSSDSICTFLVCDIVHNLLDSNVLTRKDLVDHIPTLLKSSKAIRTDTGRSIFTDMMYVLAYMNTKECWEEIAQYQYVPEHDVVYTALDILADSGKQMSSAAMDTLAADKYYRLNLYYLLNGKEKIDLFPKKYWSQRSFAESYLEQADEDQYYTDYTYLVSRSVVYKEKKQRFYLYTVVTNDDEKTPYLAIVGPFSTDDKQVDIDSDENITGFYDEPLKGSAEDQLKVYLIKRKIDEKRNAE